MPTYEYQCDDCGHLFERFQSMTARPLRSCPQCKGKVRRLLGTGAGVIFKGSGFYETDYKRSAASRNGAASTNASEGAGSGGSDSSTKSAKSTGSTKSDTSD
jgi:putative FmdB family regulatory protein